MLRRGRKSSGRGGVAAVAIGGGSLAIVMGVLLALVLVRPASETAAASAAPFPSASLGAGTSDEPSSSPQPRATSPPEQTEAPSLSVLANRAVAEVAVAGLSLRREPGGGAEVRATLDEGARVFVIGAPQLVDGRPWYRVAVVDGPSSRCSEGYCPNDIGWVAEGGTAEDAWLPPVALDCPPSPMTVEQLETLRPLERLSCYGGSDIVVTGTLDNCYCGLYGPLTYEPGWLAMPISMFVFHHTQTLIRFEDGTPPDLLPGDVVRVTLAMEHEAATTCIVRGNPDWFGPMPSGQSPPEIQLPDQAETVLGCRTQLVMKSYEVIGFEDVSLPGG